MSEKPQVLFIGDLNWDIQEYKDFQKKFQCIHYQLTTLDQLIVDFQSKFRNIQAIYGAWLGFFLLGGFKGKILENAPKSLKIVSICSVGFDGYDGEEMAKRDIILTNVPSEGACEPVADLVLYNTLASFRNFKSLHENLTPKTNHLVQFRKQADSKQFDNDAGKLILGESEGYSFGHYVGGRPSMSPKGHHVAIVGFGGIGQAIGKRLSNIGMHIHYIKRTQLSEADVKKLGFKVEYHKNLSDVKGIADLIVIACPSTPETRHLVNEKVIEEHEKSFRIINIGRGSVINEEALVKGLKSGKILFAGLDVFEEEPKVHPELFNREDVILTPHIGASTIENFDFTAMYALKNIENVLLKGEAPLSRVN